MNNPQPKFRRGQRVVLKGVDPCPDYPDGIPEEAGVCQGIDMFGDNEAPGPYGEPFPDQQFRPPYFYIVEVDPGYTTGDCSDDGLRGMVPEEMLELEEVCHVAHQGT